MRCAVIVFPGSNCDQDLCHALRVAIQADVTQVPHTATTLEGFDAVFLPGGFSYGDYLRAGAIARFAPVMAAVVEVAAAGLPVIGICNGFQMLLEAGLLPGAMKHNASLHFQCRDVGLRVENVETPFTSTYTPQQIIRLPIAHGEGNYECDDATLAALEADHRVVFRYTAPVNGSRHDIAGIINARGNVLGMMPHPERAVEALLGNTDGLGIFASLQRYGSSSHVAS